LQGKSLTPLQVVGSRVLWFVRLQFLKGEKGKLVLVHAVKTYRGRRVYLHSFLTPAIGGGECSISRPGLFTPQTPSPWRETLYLLNRRLGDLETRKKSVAHNIYIYIYIYIHTHTHTHSASFEIRTGRIFILLSSEIKIFYFTA
jgi:hypothetical protein